MKKRVSLFLALMIALSLLAGCGSKADTQTDTDASTPPVTSTEDDSSQVSNAQPDADKLDGANNGKESDHDSRNPYMPLTEEAPREVHDMDVESLVADYQSGAWDGGHPLWSEDGTTFVAISSEGYLTFNYNHIQVYDDDGLKMAKRIVSELDKGRHLPLPNDWQGEKVYPDLPMGQLPQVDVLGSAYVVGKGTLVQVEKKITLYQKGTDATTWKANTEERSLLMAQLDESGTSYVLVDNQVLRLNDDGTTEVTLENVVDAGWSAMPFLIALTIEDGALVEHYTSTDSITEPSWTERPVLNDVTDARLMLGRTLFTTDIGLTFAVDPLPTTCQQPNLRLTCLGRRTLDEVQTLWDEYDEFALFLSEKQQNFIDRLSESAMSTEGWGPVNEAIAPQWRAEVA